MESVKSTTRTGAAAVHLVCADLLLTGYNAFVAAEGLHYDVVVDVGGRLYRVQVKSCSAPRGRPSRPSMLHGYQFTSTRNRRPGRIEHYNPAIIDFMAFVALDIRTVAYFAITKAFTQGVWLYPPGTRPFSGVRPRHCIDAFPFSRALEKHKGTIWREKK